MNYFRYKTYLLGIITVQHNTNPSENVCCVCSRLLINCRKRSCIQNTRLLNNSNHLDVTFPSLENYYLRNINIVNSAVNLPNESVTLTTDDLKLIPGNSTADVEIEGNSSCCCNFLFLGTMLRYLQKKLRKRIKYKSLRRRGINHSEATNPDTNNATTAKFPKSSLKAKKTNNRSSVNVTAVVEDVIAKDCATASCSIDPIKSGLQHMGYSFNRTNQNTSKRIFLDYDKAKIEQWNKNLIFQTNNATVQPSDDQVDVEVNYFNYNLTLPTESKITNNSPQDQIQFNNEHFSPEISTLDCAKNVPNTSFPNVTNFDVVDEWPKPVPGIKRNRSKKIRNKKQKLNGMKPPEILQNKYLEKYWNNRYQLFSKFDEGIKLDAESWYSVTPEKIAKHIADRCRCDIIMDGFCGVGGNSIQFAFTCERVIAIDIDPKKILMAKNNAKMYGVDDRIEFIVGDFFNVAPCLLADVVFLSPPWGGPKYNINPEMSIEEILIPHGGKRAYDIARKISEHIAYFLPRNINLNDIVNLVQRGGKVEVEQNLLANKLKGITAYFGELVDENLVVFNGSEILRASS